MADLPIGAFFAQVALILLICRVVGLLAARVGQPQVMAEMVAGFLIGPSLFGWLAPRPPGSNLPRRLAPGPLRRQPDRAGALHVLRRPGVPLRADGQARAAGGGGLDCRHRRAARAGRRPGRHAVAERRLLRPEGVGRFPCRAVRRRGAVDHRFPGAGADHLRAGNRRDRDGFAGARRRRARRCRGVGHPGDRARQLHRERDAGAGRRDRRSGLRLRGVRGRPRRCCDASMRSPRTRAAMPPWMFTIVLALLAAGAWFTDLRRDPRGVRRLHPRRRDAARAVCRASCRRASSR